MKVRELMDKLEQFNPNMEVMMWNNNNGYHYDIEIEDAPVRKNLDNDLESIIELHEK